MADQYVESVPGLRGPLFDQQLASSYRSYNPLGKMNYGVEAQYAIQLIAVAYEKKVKDGTKFKIRVGSVFDAICLAGSLGLTLSPAQKLCYLIPNKDDIKLDISYRGIQALYYKNGGMSRMAVEIVREGDVFEHGYSQDGPTFIHKPRIQRGNDKPGILAYCYAKFENGESYLETMSETDFKRVQNAAQKNSGGKLPLTYSLWEGEMWKKAVIRRAAKRWPALVSEADEARLFEEDIDELVESASEKLEFEPESRDGFISEKAIEALFVDVAAHYGDRAADAIPRWKARLCEKYGVSSLESLRVERMDELANDIAARLDALREAGRTPPAAEG